MTKTRGRPKYPDRLTPAEWRVAEAVRHGLTNPQIASKQDISVDAVKFHVSNMLSKLGFSSRKQLQLWDGVAATSAIKNKDHGTMEQIIGAIGQIARTVRDIEAATDWYENTLGLTKLFTFEGLAFFDCDGTRLMLSQTAEPVSESILYFKVSDIHAVLDQIVGRGAKIRSAPHMIHQHEDGSEEWMAFVDDNEGRPLGVMSTVKK